MSNMATITPRIVWDTLSLKQEFIKRDANKKSRSPARVKQSVMTGLHTNESV